MERDEAIRRLKELEGQNLHDLANKFGVTVKSHNGKANKGWAGHVCERHLGLPLNSSQCPNFGSWELKSIPLKRSAKGILTFKETMAITMIDPYNVKETPFENSHLLGKLKKLVIFARTVGEKFTDPSFVHSVTAVDLKGDLLDTVCADYELIRECLNNPKLGFSRLTGKMGTYIQPRTKGPGHGSTSRAFYARKEFLAQIIDLNK